MPLRRIGTADPVRRVPINWALQGEQIRFKLEYYADEDYSSVKFAADPAWLEISLNDGGLWTQLQSVPSQGYDIGAVSSGSKTTIDFRLTVPDDVPRRRERVDILIGVEQ